MSINKTSCVAVFVSSLNLKINFEVRQKNTRYKAKILEILIKILHHYSDFYVLIRAEI